MHLARNGGDPSEAPLRRILIVGTRTLYLQALCELLDAAGLVASLLLCDQLHGLSLDPKPSVVLVDCTEPDGLEELMTEVRELCSGSQVLLLTSGTVRESSKQAAALHADGWVTFSLPAAEFVEVLSDRGTRASGARVGTARTSRRSDPGSGWPLSCLSERELSVLRLFVAGSSPEDIAATLGISRHTVRTHLQNIMAKMLVRSRTEMVSVARKSGMRRISSAPES